MLSPNLTPRVEKCQQKQKLAHDNKKHLRTFKKGGKVLVLNKHGKTRWLSGTIVEQKSPVTYLVKVGHQMRLCHTDQLLHSKVTNVDNEPDIDDVPELTSAPMEPEAIDPAPGTVSEGVSIPVPV